MMRYYEDIKKWRSWTDPEKCMGIGHCVIKCPNGARKMQLVRPPEFIPDWVPIRPELAKSTTAEVLRRADEGDRT